MLLASLASCRSWCRAQPSPLRGYVGSKTYRSCANPMVTLWYLPPSWEGCVCVCVCVHVCSRACLPYLDSFTKQQVYLLYHYHPVWCTQCLHLPSLQATTTPVSAAMASWPMAKPMATHTSTMAVLAGHTFPVPSATHPQPTIVRPTACWTHPQPHMATISSSSHSNIDLRGKRQVYTVCILVKFSPLLSVVILLLFDTYLVRTMCCSF